jgi:hypothetical protein
MSGNKMSLSAIRLGIFKNGSIEPTIDNIPQQLEIDIPYISSSINSDGKLVSLFSLLPDTPIQLGLPFTITDLESRNEYILGKLQQFALIYTQIPEPSTHIFGSIVNNVFRK